MGTISLCMIVKNEEKSIADCLNSVKELVDEIIIVDTGSTDRTKQIAKEFVKNFASKGKIFDFKWTDDFSSARNESIKHATKDWVLVLDADEILDSEAVKAIKTLVESGDADAYLLLQKNYTNDSAIAGFVSEIHKKDGKECAGWYGSLIVRLFRNKKGYSFSGIVHELAEPSIEEKKGKMEVTTIAINHYGNSDRDIVRKKRQFYLELCKKKVKEKEDDSAYFELGVLYKENGDENKALESFGNAVRSNPKNWMAHLELGIIHEKQKNYNEAIKSYTESLRIKESGEAFQNLGVCYLKKGMLKEAYANLVKSIVLNPNKYSAYNNLGALFERKGEYQKAVEMLEIAVKLNPANVIGFYNRAVAFDKMGKFEQAMKDYEKAVELGHRKADDIKKRINQLKVIIAKSPNYGYSFKFGE